MSIDDASGPERIAPYQGWWVLSATFVCAMVVIGSTIYAFQLFVVPVEQEFGLSRAAVNQGLSLFMIGSACWAPIAGRLLDRLPAPLVTSCGGGLIALAMAGIAATSSLVVMAALLAGPMALGALCAGGLANTTIVSRWFRRRRGRALGLATVSSGAGGFVMVQIVSALIGQYGWRGALVRTGGLLALTIGALALGLIRSRPSDEQLARAGELASAGVAAGSADPERVWTPGELVRVPNFWLIALGAGLLMASDGALLASKVPYLLELGFEPARAAFLVACMTASSVVGKIAIGLAADRLELRRLFAIVAVCHVLLLSALIAQPRYELLLVMVSLFGVGVGGVYPLLATLTAACFGSTSFGSVAGSMQLVLHPLSIALLTFIGASHDATGSYVFAFQVFIAIVLVATALAFAIRPPQATRP